VHRYPTDGMISEKIVYLLNYAIQAPSAFNSQPWKFRVDGNTVVISPDFSVWIEPADPEQRQVFISLGCAVENLMIAASHFGLNGSYFWNEETRSFHITFEINEERGLHAFLFDSIEKRRTHHGDFESRKIEKERMDAIQACVDHPDLTLFFYEDPRIIRFVDDLWFKCDIAQYSNPVFRKEFYRLFQEKVLDPWVLIEKLGRFSTSLLDAACSSVPLRGAPLFALLCAKKSNPLIWAEVGRVFERIFLKTTSLGLKLKPICSFIAEANVREELSSILPDPNWIAIQPFSLGYAPDSSSVQKMRKPLESMLVLKEALT
jgi:hypothetical protein